MISFSILVTTLAVAIGSSPFSAALEREEAASCDAQAAGDAFASYNISLARAILSAHQDSPKSQRECAVNVWRQGIDNCIRQGYKYNPDLRASSQASPAAGRDLDACNAKISDGTWLNIPRLMEVVICLELHGRAVVLEQDGFLRAYDMATVLWPAGFFLAHWSARHCGGLTGRVLELGAGVGAPSIVASQCGGNVVATDKAPYALVNIGINANINAVELRAIQTLNWSSPDDVDMIAAEHGTFDVILGAGLAPHRWTEWEWSVLARLVHPVTGKVVLCQGFDDLDKGTGILGNGAFKIESVFSGDEYGLQTRWGGSSEFEVVVLKRAAPSSNEEL